MQRRLKQFALADLAAELGEGPPWVLLHACLQLSRAYQRVGFLDQAIQHGTAGFQLAERLLHCHAPELAVEAVEKVLAAVPFVKQAPSELGCVPICQPEAPQQHP